MLYSEPLVVSCEIHTRYGHKYTTKTADHLIISSSTPITCNTIHTNTREPYITSDLLTSIWEDTEIQFTLELTLQVL